MASLWVRMWTAAASRGGSQKATDVDVPMTKFGKVNGQSATHERSAVGSL